MRKKAAELFAFRGILENASSNSVAAADGILKKIELWCAEGKNDKAQGNETKKGDGDFWRNTTQLLLFEKPCLADICDCGTNKENGNVEPIGGFSDGTVVGIKDHGDQDLPQQDRS